MQSFVFAKGNSLDVFAAILAFYLAPTGPSVIFKERYRQDHSSRALRAVAWPSAKLKQCSPGYPDVNYIDQPSSATPWQNYKMDFDKYGSVEEIAQASKYGAIIALVMVVVLAIIVFYYAYQRNRMDELQNNGPFAYFCNALNGGLDGYMYRNTSVAPAVTPAPVAAETTIGSIIEASHLRLMGFLVVAAALGGAAILALIANKTGPSNIITYLLLAVSAGLLYVGLRAVQSIANITKEKGDSQPAFVYESIKNIEILATVGLAMSAFFLAVSYLTYTSVTKKLDQDVRGQNVRAGSVAVEPSVAKAAPVIGGYIDIANLAPLRTRALGAQ